MIKLCLSTIELMKYIFRLQISRKFGSVAARQSFSPHLNSQVVVRHSFRKIHMEKNLSSASRGALIVLEGLDRSGKTSQSTRLLSYLEGLGHPVESWRFPDRNTGVGQMISSYLANESHLDDHAIIFSSVQIVGRRGL